MPLSTSLREKLHKASLKGDSELQESYAESFGQLHGMKKALMMARKVPPTQVAKDIKTPSEAVKPKPAIKPVDASSHAELAKVIENKTIPAVESLKTSQAASHLELENNQAHVEAVSDAYSGYNNTLLSVADSMSYLALTAGIYQC